MSEEQDIEQVEKEEILEDEVLLWKQIKEDLANLFGVGDLSDYSTSIKQAFFICFIILIALFHIYNSHKAVRFISDKNKLEEEIKQLRWEELSIRSNMLNRSMFSKIEGDIDSLGLKSLVEPPFKIVAD